MNLKKVTGTPFLCTCVKCGKKDYIDRLNFYADLEGKPFQDYYCVDCANEINKVKIISKMSLDYPPKQYYQIQEIVTSNGLYIEWDNIFNSKENAQKEIDNVFKRV